jgi:RHS repeat-associated protein
LFDYDGSSGQIARWYSFGSGLNEVLNQVNVSANTRTTFIPDTQGSIIGTLDSSSGAITKTGYQVFGESTSTAGTFRYTGARIDAETNGLYDLRARMYSSVLGRFLQPDPKGYISAGNAIRYDGAINLYVYVGNDPLNATDPLGLDTQYFVGVSGTLAILFGGIGGSFTFGVSVPDNPSNYGNYQFFGTLQGNAMLGIGLYAGAGVTGGVSHTEGPLPPGASASTGRYIEGDIGVGPSVGGSVQAESASSFGAGFNPAPQVGFGYGIWFGAGGYASGTLATPPLNSILMSPREQQAADIWSSSRPSK